MTLENSETVEHEDVAIKLHQTNEGASNNVALGEDAAIGIDQGLTGDRVVKLLQQTGKRVIVDASTLTDADMDITMIDQYIATMTKHGSTLAFANKTAEVEAANKGFFDALRARGIAVTSNTEKPEEEEAIAA